MGTLPRPEYITNADFVKTVLMILWLWVLWDRNRALIMGTLFFFVLTELAIVSTSVYAIVFVTRMLSSFVINVLMLTCLAFFSIDCVQH